MSIQLSATELHKLMAVIGCMNHSLDDDEWHTRRNLAEHLLDLLHADYYASYLWNDVTRRFEQGVHVNMSADSVEHYQQYFQFHDPITHRMQRHRRAVSVNQVMPQRELVRTEFFNDFLARDGLYYGVNLYIYEGNRNVADLRIWRSRGRGNFDERCLQLLDLVAPHLRNAISNLALVRQLKARQDPSTLRQLLTHSYRLMARETDVALEILRGKTDQQIATGLYTSIATVRTHVRHIYEKLNVHNRTSLCHRLLPLHSPEKATGTPPLPIR